MEGSDAPAAPLRVRFEVPRSEFERAEGAARAFGPRGPPADIEFEHLRGRVFFDLQVPLEDDPLLRHLAEKHAVRTKPPLTVALDQPVAYLLAQAAGGAVLALHGEGEFSVRLTGGRGALSVAADGEALHLGLPLEAYAGVAAVPRTDAAHALAAAASAMAALMKARPALAMWPVAAFLDKEARILAADGAAGAPPLPQKAAWGPQHGPLQEHLSALERSGAHIVAYWRATAADAGTRVRFEPLRSPGLATRAGALALAIRPRQEELIEANVRGDARATERLRKRLMRRSSFIADFGASFAIEEPSGELPMA